MKHKITGTGSVIVLLRGLGRSFDYWLNFETELAKHFKVVMINLPAMDDLSEKTPLTIKQNAKMFAEKLISLEEQIGKGPYNIFGLSLGGMTALSIAYYYPELVNTLIIGSSSVKQYKIKRINYIPLLKILFMHLLPQMPKTPHRSVGKYLVSKRFLSEHPEIINIWDKIWQKQKISKTNFIKQLFAALFALTPSKLKKIKNITLILSGDEDRLVPPDNSNIIQKHIKNSVHISLPMCGHDITTEESEYITKIIKDFCLHKNIDDIKTNYTTIKEPVEFEKLKQLQNKFSDIFYIEPLDFIEYQSYKTPVYSFFVDHKPKAELPTLAFFACFHGVEMISTNVLINFLEHFLQSTKHDDVLKDLCQKINICGIPLVNPVGRINKTRTNGNNIDLMRNSPINSTASSFMLGGQDLSSKLPWYMGENIEKENKITIDFLDKYVFPSEFKISLDIHSGFVNKSRIWIPYANGKHLEPELQKLYDKAKLLFENLYKYNEYEFEKQKDIYKTHGDFWDYNLDRHIHKEKGHYMPLTLEISSLKWSINGFLKKWKFENLFNPIKEKEKNAEYIKHLHFLYFLLNLTKNNKNFINADNQNL